MPHWAACAPSWGWSSSHPDFSPVRALGAALGPAAASSSSLCPQNLAHSLHVAHGQCLLNAWADLQNQDGLFLLIYCSEYHHAFDRLGWLTSPIAWFVHILTRPSRCIPAPAYELWRFHPSLVVPCALHPEVWTTRGFHLWVKLNKSENDCALSLSLFSLIREETLPMARSSKGHFANPKLTWKHTSFRWRPGLVCFLLHQ